MCISGLGVSILIDVLDVDRRRNMTNYWMVDAVTFVLSIKQMQVIMFEQACTPKNFITFT